jgi:uncharacterized membrane protein YkoI
MRKALVLGLAAILALGIFAGCGQQQAPAEQQPAQVESQVQENNSADPAADQQGKVVEDGVVMDPADYDLISKEKAKNIALGKVDGASESDIFQFDLDFDDGRWVYEGEIHKGEWEYEFEINAESGDVISFEKDHIYD